MKNKFISVSRAKAKLLELVRTLSDKGESYVLTKDGEPVGALLSMEVYDAFLETVEIQESPQLMAQLEEALHDEKQGRIWMRDKKGQWLKYKESRKKKAA